MGNNARCNVFGSPKDFDQDKMTNGVKERGAYEEAKRA